MRDTNPSQGFGNLRAAELGAWEAESNHWRDRYRERPYVKADAKYEDYEPGYRYGWESAQRHRGKRYEDVEQDLQAGWAGYAHAGRTTWEQINGAVRDGWSRIAI